MNEYFKYEPNHAENKAFRWGLLRFDFTSRPGFWFVMPVGDNPFVKSSYAVINDFGDLVPVP